MVKLSIVASLHGKYEILGETEQFAYFRVKKLTEHLNKLL